MKTVAEIDGDFHLHLSFLYPTSMKNGNIAPSKIHQRILFNDGISDANSPSELGPCSFTQLCLLTKARRTLWLFA